LIVYHYYSILKNNLIIPKALKPIFRPLRPIYYRYLFKPKPTPEEETLQLYPKFMDPNDVVIEVGARVGGGTLQLSNLVKHVFSFEPNSDSYKLLKKHTSGKDNITLYNLALGEKEDERTLFIGKYMKFSHIATLKKRGNVEYEIKEKVKMKRLDDLEFPLTPTALIIDCEGLEGEVLMGAKKTLNNIKKVLVETHKLSDGISSKDKVVSLLPGFKTNFKKGWVIALSE